MKRQLNMILTLAVAVALPALALAQTPQTPKTPPATAKPSTTDTKSTTDAKASASADSAFMHTAAMGGMAEVELGKLGVANAMSSDVKQFAQRMVDDHSKANDELKALAAQKSVKLPAELDAKHKALHDKLAKQKGAAFDAAYMSEMVSDHNTDVALFQKESKSGKDADTKAWAAKTLPTLQEHQKMAKEIHAKTGKGTQ
jgi:putative membrane protein